MIENNKKYLLIVNVRTSNGLSSDVFYFDTPTDAEIEFYAKVSVAIQDKDIILAHYIVVNEYGVKLDNLEKIIDNQKLENIIDAQEINSAINETMFNIEQ